MPHKTPRIIGVQNCPLVHSWVVSIYGSCRAWSGVCGVSGLTVWTDWLDCSTASTASTAGPARNCSLSSHRTHDVRPQSSQSRH